MKKLLSIVLLMFAVLSLPLSRPALAADTASGAKIFSANCAACHVFLFVVPSHWSLVTNN